jgi:hypothetical protein
MDNELQISEYFSKLLGIPEDVSTTETSRAESILYWLNLHAAWEGLLLNWMRNKDGKVLTSGMHE